MVVHIFEFSFLEHLQHELWVTNEVSQCVKWCRAQGSTFVQREEVFTNERSTCSCGENKQSLAFDEKLTCFHGPESNWSQDNLD